MIMALNSVAFASRMLGTKEPKVIHSTVLSSRAHVISEGKA